MIEIEVLTGNKHNWATDIQLAEMETLEPLQAFFKQFGACVIDGCTVTANGGNWDIAAGIVAINHADGFKLARFAGVTNTALPGYLSIAKTTQNGPYDDNPSKAISYTYAASFTAGAAPDGTSLYLPIVNSNIGFYKTFTDAFAAQSLTSYVTYNHTITSGLSTQVDIQLKYRLNRATNQLYLKGTVQINDFNVGGIGNDVSITLGVAGTVLSGYVPSEVRTVMGFVDINSAAGNEYKIDENSADYIDTAILRMHTDGSLYLRVKKPAIGTYTVRFNEIIPLT